MVRVPIPFRGIAVLLLAASTAVGQTSEPPTELLTIDPLGPTSPNLLRQFSTDSRHPLLTLMTDGEFASADPAPPEEATRLKPTPQPSSAAPKTPSAAAPQVSSGGAVLSSAPDGCLGDGCQGGGWQGDGCLGDGCLGGESLFPYACCPPPCCGHKCHRGHRCGHKHCGSCCYGYGGGWGDGSLDGMSCAGCCGRRCGHKHGCGCASYGYDGWDGCGCFASCAPPAKCHGHKCHKHNQCCGYADCGFCGYYASPSNCGGHRCHRHHGCSYDCGYGAFDCGCYGCGKHCGHSRCHRCRSCQPMCPSCYPTTPCWGGDTFGGDTFGGEGAIGGYSFGGEGAIGGYSFDGEGTFGGTVGFDTALNGSFN